MQVLRLEPINCAPFSTHGREKSKYYKQISSYHHVQNEDATRTCFLFSCWTVSPRRNNLDTITSDHRALSHTSCCYYVDSKQETIKG